MQLRFNLPIVALGATVLVALISTIGGVVYLLFNLSFPAVIVTLALSLVAEFFILRKIVRDGADVRNEDYLVGSRYSAVSTDARRGQFYFFALIPLYTLAVVCITLLTRNRTELALNTPWTVVPPLFWIAAVLMTACGVALLLRANGPTLVFLTTLPLLGVSVSVALLVYNLGYGFDPFIHKAAEQHILTHGFITPKTIYYAGQYAITVLLARVTTLNPSMIDTFLLPALATISIPSALAYVRHTLSVRLGVFVASVLMLLPIAPFINTTPFGLAALFAFLAALMGLASKKEPRALYLVWIFAVASSVVHPLAGIPALTLAGLLQFKNPFVRGIITVGGAIALPVLFSRVAQWSFNLNTLSSLELPFTLPLTRFSGVNDMVYALPAFVALIVVMGLVVSLWNKTIRGSAYALAALGTFVSGILLALFVSFSYLPDYEQGGYPARLFLLALLLALPPAAIAVAVVLERSIHQPLRAFGAVMTLTLALTGGLYLAYPRSDAYTLSHGWNTSRADIQTVRAIAIDAGDEPYIVLASQPVSAAALHEFGFFKYFNSSAGPLFAYPVPTGGPLYPYFLKMAYEEPSAASMHEAMMLTGVHRGYFVMNTYWTRSDHIIGRAKQTADEWFGINNANFIFRYSR